MCLSRALIHLVLYNLEIMTLFILKSWHFFASLVKAMFAYNEDKNLIQSKLMKMFTSNIKKIYDICKIMQLRKISNFIHTSTKVLLFIVLK